jgi:hypothetical protein
MRAEWGIVFLGVLVLCSGCLGSPGNLPPCDSWDSGNSICRLMNPEDLGLLPREGWIIVSEMTHSDPRATAEGPPFKSGRLTAIRLSESGGEEERRVLYPQEWDEELPDAIRWGDPECIGPPTSRDFQPHGLDVGPGPEGRPALAVVTHGEREVIDLFEIDADFEPLLEWRGCVTVPETVNANDVAMLEDGSLLVTNFMPRFDKIGFSALWQVLKINFGVNSGSVLRWRAEEGFAEIPNSEGSAPNGIAASPDGRIVYVSEWGDEKVYRLRMPVDDGEVPARDEVEIDGSPDNLTWTADGQLLVAAQKAGPIKALGCGQIKAGGCDLGYSITRIDPVEFEAETIAEGRGAASVALEVGDEIFVGVFAGDSIARIANPE